jgi:ubiquinone/menaquinone biosynthesis C-methylase UbiE
LLLISVLLGVVPLSPILPPPGSAVAGDAGRLAGVLHLDQVAPGVGSAAIEVGEAIDQRFVCMPGMVPAGSVSSATVRIMTDDGRKARIVGIFDRAAPTYEQVGVEFFGPPGRRLAERAQLRPGERVLDLGCGRGASLFPAAEAVGPDGEVVGLDLAPAMLARTAAEADRRGLGWVRVRQGDAERPDEPEGSFDAVVAGFVVYFLDDPAAAVARWGRLLRPGGRLVLSTFTERSAAEIATFAAAAGAVRPFQPPAEPGDHDDGPPPDEIYTAAWLRGLFDDSGLTDVDTVEITQRSVFASPEVVWDFVLSAGGRPMLERIPPEHRPAARTALAEAVAPHLRQPDGTYARTTGFRLTRARRPR